MDCRICRQRPVARPIPFGAPTAPFGAQSKSIIVNQKTRFSLARRLQTIHERERDDMTSDTHAKPDREPVPRAIQTVLDALEKLRFGAIQLTVHEGRLVQVDVTERHRYPN